MQKSYGSTAGARALHQLLNKVRNERIFTTRAKDLLETAHFMQERGVPLDKILAWIQEEVKKEVA